MWWHTSAVEARAFSCGGAVGCGCPSWIQVATCKPTHRFLTDLGGLLRPLWCVTYLQEDLYIMIYKFKYTNYANKYLGHNFPGKLHNNK